MCVFPATYLISRSSGHRYIELLQILLHSQFLQMATASTPSSSVRPAPWSAPLPPGPVAVAAAAEIGPPPGLELPADDDEDGDTSLLHQLWCRPSVRPSILLLTTLATVLDVGSDLHVFRGVLGSMEGIDGRHRIWCSEEV